MRFLPGYAIIQSILSTLRERHSMAQILLVRHAVNDYVKTGKLAGRLPDIHLNEEGLAQAEALGARLQDTPIHHLYASPLDRTMETAQAIQKYQPALTIQPCTEMIEVDYGEWQGQSIAALSGRKMWHVIQQYPSRASFPNGETLLNAQIRAVNAVEALAAQHPRQTVVIVSHADLIKMVVAHFLGMHLDNFQRIIISPASISTLSLGYGRPYVGTVNDTTHIALMERERKRAQAAEPTS